LKNIIKFTKMDSNEKKTVKNDGEPCYDKLLNTHGMGYLKNQFLPTLLIALFPNQAIILLI